MNNSTELFIKIKIEDNEFNPLNLPELVYDPKENAQVWDDFTDETLKSLLRELSSSEPQEVGRLLREIYIENVHNKTAKMPESQLQLIQGTSSPQMSYYSQKFGPNAYALFEKYTEKIFAVNEGKDNKLIAFNEDAIKEIIDLTKDSTTSTQELRDAKKMLGSLIHQYFLDINTIIDPEKFDEFRQNVIEKLNYYENESGERIHRTNTLIALNGQVLAGKGTTMGILGLEAPVETGTAGILGAGPNHEHWSESSIYTQLVRDEGFIPPDKVMGTMFMLELAKRRSDMDNVGNEDKAVVISGFPRTEDQAQQLNGVDGIKAVYMDMTATENAHRTIRRIIETIASNRINGTNEPVRGDDIGSIFLADKNGRQMTEAEIIELITKSVNSTDINKLKEIDNSFKIGQELINSVPKLNEVYEEVQLSEKARWHTYNKTKDQIANALKNIGVDQKVMMVDGKSPNQVAEEVQQLI